MDPPQPPAGDLPGQQINTTPLPAQNVEPMEIQQELKIEDLTLDKKLEQLKKYSYIDYYDEGRFIDAQDTVNTWCLGQVVQVIEKTVRVHYDGWSNKWDLTAKIGNYKLAPFRKFSRGYTGQVRTALRQNMKFSLDDLLIERNRVQKIIDDDFQSLGAFNVTQYFRGQLYIYLDFLLQNNKYQAEEVLAINDFVQTVLRFITGWFRRAKKLIPLYSQIKVNQDLFLIDENIAVLQSVYEICDMLKKIFGGCHRCIKYYILNDKQVVPFENPVTDNAFGQMNFEEKNLQDEDLIDNDKIKDDIASRKNIVYGQLINFLNYFAEQGGFDAIVDFLRSGNETQEDKVPLDLISLVVAPFRTCNTVFSQTFTSQFTQQVRDIFQQRLQTMTEKELKEIDKESISRVLKELKDFLTLSMNEMETAQFIELNQLNMSFRFLKSTYLEKKLKGLQEIKTMISAIESFQVVQQQRQKLMNDPQYAGKFNPNFDFTQNMKEKPPKYINAESLRDWILSQKLLEIVFGENTHVEIVKRSGCILKFLAKQGSLPPESVDLLWKCQLGKHEDMVRVVYSTIQEIVPSVDVGIVDLFYQRITQVQPSQYDDKFLEFLKDFTLKALANYHDTKAAEQSIDEEHASSFEEAIKKRETHVFSHIKEYLSNPASWDSDDKPYGLPIFWEMIQDRSSTSTDLTQQSIASLSEILKQPNTQPVKVSFLLRALDNILKGESVAQSIVIAQKIIGDYSAFDSKDDLLTISNIIIALAKQIDIVNRIISNIEGYHAAVKERSRALIEKNKTIPDDVSTSIFVGKHTHKETLEATLGFLEFIVLSSDHQVTLGTANIDRLWAMFVQQPNFNSDQTLYLQWINKHRDNYHSENLLFNEQEREHFFTKILCNRTYVDFQKITPGQAKSFHKFFKLINKVHGYIISSHKKVVVCEYEKLIGLEPLRQIAIQSENERTKDDSMDLLVDLHLKFDADKITLEHQSQIWADFIKSCMQQLDSPDDRLVSNTLQLLSKFLDRYEGKKTFKTETKVTYGGFNQMQMLVILRPDMIKKNINFNYQQTIGQIRLKIAETFGFQVNEFNMGIKNTLVDPDEEDDKILREYGILQSIIIVKNPNYNPDLHPKKMISQIQENYDKLFSLLTKDSKSHLIEAAWDLLQKLPINEKLHQEIKDLSGMQLMNDNKQKWEQLLDPKSINKLLYSLQIVSQINGGNRKDQKPNQWRYKFIQMGGLQHLMRTFLSLNVPSIESNLTIKCIQNLIMTLHDVMNADRDKDSNNMQMLLDKKDLVVDKCFHIVDLIGDYVITLEKQRGESFEEIQRRIIQNKIKKNKYKSYMAVNVKQQQTEKQEEEEDHESTEYNLSQQIIKQFDEQQKIVNLLFSFLQMTIFQHDRTASLRVAQYENLSKMLMKTTLQVENFHIRLEVLNKIKDIISNRSGTPEIMPMLRIVKILTLEIQPAASQFESRCFQFYEGLTQIIDILTFDDIKSLKEPLVQMIQELSKFIFDREVREKSTNDTDHLLVGKMKLLKSLLQKFPEQKRIIGEYLTKHLIHDCLFEIPHGSSLKQQTVGGPPKCKTSASRSAAFRLLSVLCRDTLPNLDLVLNYLHQFNEHPSWRTHKDQDWQISLMDSEKSSTGYVGIKNLGCICYMNSLFQQLFMIKSLRNDVLSIPEDHKQEKDENMFYQLQLLFAGLLKSEKQYVNPKGFCHAFKDWDGNPTNVLEQMDVEEFFNMLMDRIETAIKGSPQQDTIKQHFGGKYANEMICKGCPHKYDRTEDFLTIPVPVKNQKSLQQGLLATVQGEMLEGENAYYCEKCDKKVDTLKRQCIKRLPRYMMLPLKRFEFDYDKMIRVKVNEYFEFPLEINMEPYTSEGLSKRERIQKAKEEKGEEEAQAIVDEIEKEPSKYPKEYYEYQLSGIVVHSGTADSGHYYSFIKDRENPQSGKWYEMNDAMVRDFDPKEIPAECFGGEDTFTGYNMMQMKSVRYRNAYLLFYERKSPIEVVDEDVQEAEKTGQNQQSAVTASTEISKTNDEDVEMANSMSSRGQLGAIPSVAINSEIEQKITYENQKYWQNRFLFGSEYHEFVQDISLYWNTSNIVAKNYLSKNNDFKLHGHNCPKEYEQNVSIPDPLDVNIPIADKKLVDEFELRVFKFTATCYLTISQRGSNKLVLPPLLNLLKSYINKNERCAEWLLNEMCNFELVNELLLQCTSKEMRSFVSGLIYCSLLKFYPYEKERIMDYWTNIEDPSLNTTKIGNFALVMIHNLYTAKEFSAHSTQYLQVMSRLVQLGPEIRQFFLRAKGVGRMLQFFFDDISPHHDYYRDMTDIRPIYNAHPEMGLPTVQDKKQMTQFQELIEKKRLKALAEGVPKYKYIFEAVSYMIRGYRHGAPAVGSNMPLNTPYQLDQGGDFQEILQQERDLFFPDPKFIKKMFHMGQKNKAIIALCKSYTHFTWYDKDEFAIMLDVIKIGLTENDHLEVKPFFCLIWFLLKTPGGEKAENRFDQVIIFFLECMSSNQIYYKFMEACYEFIFKLCAGMPSVFQWFKTNPDKWAWIIEYSQKISFPVDQTSQVRLYKKKSQYAQYPQYLRNEAYKNQFLQNSRNNRLSMILKGNPPGDPTELENWLIDMEDYKFRTGEQFEVYQKKSDTIQIMQVELVLDEILHLQNLSYNSNDNYNQQQKMMWLLKGSNKFQPLGVYNAQYRIKLTEMYEKSHEAKLRQNQTANQMRQGDDDQVMNYRNQGGQYGNNNESDEEDSEDEDQNV